MIIYTTLIVTFLCMIMFILQYQLDKEFKERCNEFFNEYDYSQLHLLVVFFIPFVNCYILYLEASSFIEYLQEKPK